MGSKRTAVVFVSLVASIVLLLLYPSGEDKVVIPDTPMMHTQDWQHIDAVMEVHPTSVLPVRADVSLNHHAYAGA